MKRIMIVMGLVASLTLSAGAISEKGVEEEELKALTNELTAMLKQAQDAGLARNEVVALLAQTMQSEGVSFMSLKKKERYIKYCAVAVALAVAGVGAYWLWNCSNKPVALVPTPPESDNAANNAVPSNPEDSSNDAVTSNPADHVVLQDTIVPDPNENFVAAVGVLSEIVRIDDIPGIAARRAAINELEANVLDRENA